MERPSWLKEKGYVHLSRSLDLGVNWKKTVKKITSDRYIGSYAFYPLMHTIISDRKFKKGDIYKLTTNNRKHTHYRKKTLHPVKNVKSRPIHYASHMDALIYSYYASILKDKYERVLEREPLLDQAVIAYRKIETFKDSGIGKSNIHFAKECFDEIEKRTQGDNEVAVLAIDLKSFFSSLDHKILKVSWNNILGTDELPKDHYRVYMACTKFKYVLLDDLRIKMSKKGRKAPFNESKLAEIRKKMGFKCFYESNNDFRNEISQGKLPIYSNPFYKELQNGKIVNVGIPQGLPISAVLANMYLYDFDLEVVNRWVKQYNVYYRRYSDDIFIICDKGICEKIEKDIELLISKFAVKVSTDKTEKFIFKNNPSKGVKRLECFRVTSDGGEIPSAMTYLGFEYRGYHIGIKSTNLSKYYRKIISAAKRKSNRTIKLLGENPHTKKAVFKNQLKKIYNLPVKFKDSDLVEKKVKRQIRYKLVLNDRGFYEFKFSDRKIKMQANFHSYIKRCCNEFQTKSFEKQVKKGELIANAAIHKYLNNNRKV